jgi:hypothetical protein
MKGGSNIYTSGMAFNVIHLKWKYQINSSLEASGDATEAFEDVGHSTSAISMMNSYLIGSIEGYVPPSVCEDATVHGSDEPPNSRTMQRNKGSPAPNTFLDFVLPLIMLGVAVAAWYYLTFIAKS